MQSTALFTNFSKEEFEGFWNGKGKKFKAGESMYMPDYLARHFAKHLTNRELIRRDSRGRLHYKEGEKMTSPKRPEDVPIFMKLFNKAYQPQVEEDIGDKNDDVDALIASANQNRAEGEGVSMNAEKPKPKATSSNKGNTKTAPKANTVKVEVPPADATPAGQDPSQPQTIIPPDFETEEGDDK